MEQIRFDGQAVVVTGAGNGLGREYALELGRRGAMVVVNDLGGSADGQGASQRAADDVVDQIRAAGGTAVANYDSVATAEGGQRVVQTAEDNFGRLDALIANAGFLRPGPFEDMTEDQFRAVLDVHLMQAFYVGQPAYRLMKKNGYGRILLTASAVGMFGDPWQANYGAAKAGLHGLSNVLSIEGARYGIKSNVLLPAAASRMKDVLYDKDTIEEVSRVRAAVDWTHLRPMMSPAYIMPLAVYLVSRACESTHGVYSAIAGRYARVTVGVGKGWRASEGVVPTLEDIESHWDKIGDTAVAGRPQFVHEEFKLIAEQIRDDA